MENKDPIRLLDEINRKFDNLVKTQQNTKLKRFPLLFTLLVAFGFVITIYSFEKIADKIIFFQERPIVMLIIGLSILVFTGTLYKKLK